MAKKKQRHTTKNAQHLQALNLLAKKVMDAEAKRTEMQNPTTTTVH